MNDPVQIITRVFEVDEESLYDKLLELTEASHVDLLRYGGFDLTYHVMKGHPDVRLYWMIATRESGFSLRRINCVWPSGRISVTEQRDAWGRFHCHVRGTEMAMVEATLRGLL